MEENPTPTPVWVENWPPEPEQPPDFFEVVTLPSGTQVRVDFQVSYGDLLISSLLTLALVMQLGRWLWERIRGVV